ncbi:hypothetical protein BDR26DRAFT_933197 [Obelidium mucronatum]|nr:hypothetical protein BDR26DRAFT_933197 [Obelidium mucronatum]
MADTPPATAPRKSVGFAAASSSSAAGPSNPAADQSLLTRRSAAPNLVSLKNDFDDDESEQQTNNVLDGIDEASRYMEANTDNEFDVATSMDAFRTDLLALSRLVRLQSSRLDKVMEVFAASSKAERKVQCQRSVSPVGSASDSDDQQKIFANSPPTAHKSQTTMVHKTTPKCTAVPDLFLSYQGRSITLKGEPVFQGYSYRLNATDELVFSLKEFAAFFEIKKLGREPAVKDLMGVERNKSDLWEAVITVLGWWDLSRGGAVCKVFVAGARQCFLSPPCNPPGSLPNTHDFSKYTSLLPKYTELIQASGGRDLVLFILECFSNGYGDVDSFCLPVSSHSIEYITRLRYSTVETLFWTIFLSISTAGVLRFLRGEGHKTGTGPSENRSNIAIPDPRYLQRKMNGESRQLMVHQKGVDLEPSIALGKEMLTKKPHSFLCMQIDAIHPGQTMEFVEYNRAHNRLIGCVDMIGDKTVVEVEKEFRRSREVAIEHIQRLHASRINDVWNPLNVQNSNAGLNFVFGWLQAKKRYFSHSIVPDLSRASYKASKMWLSKKDTIDSDLAANGVVNASKLQSLKSLEFRHTTLFDLYKKTTQLLGLLVVLLVLLEESLEEIILRGYVRRDNPYFISDVARWKYGFKEPVWRELLIFVVNQVSLLELNWKTISIHAADQVAAFVVVDSMSGKNSTASICAISGSGPKDPIFQHAWSLGQQIHEKEPKLLVRSFTTDGEFFSLIGNPFGDSQYTLYRSLHQGTEQKISDLLEGKRGIARSLCQANAITVTMAEYLSTRQLVHQLPPPVLNAEAIVWLRQSRSLIDEPKTFMLPPSIAVEFVRQLLAKAHSSNLNHHSPDLYILAESIVLHFEPSLFFSESNQPKLLLTIQQLWEKYSEDFQSLVEVTIEFYTRKQEELQPRDSHYSIEDQELVGLWRVLQSAITPKSSHLTMAPMSKVLSSVLFHVRHSIDLAVNRQHLKSQTSLNVDIYHPLPHPLDDSKSLLINPDYDHLIPKNLVKGICACNYEGIGSSLEGILDASWFCRDTQNVELGKKAFSETTCQYLATEGNVTGAEFLEDVSNLYRAIDERGISNLERIQFVKGMEKQILDRFGKQLSSAKTCRNGHFDGLSYTSVLGLLILCRNFLTLCDELASEGVDMSAVLFIGRAVFGNNFVEQYFNNTRRCNTTAKTFQSAIIMNNTNFFLGLNNESNTYLAKSAVENLDDWVNAACGPKSRKLEAQRRMLEHLQKQTNAKRKITPHVNQRKLTESERQNRNLRVNVRAAAIARGREKQDVILSKVYKTTGAGIGKGKGKKNVTVESAGDEMEVDDTKEHGLPKPVSPPPDDQSDSGSWFESSKSDKISLRVAKPPVFKGLTTDDFDDFMLKVYLNFDNSGPKGILSTKSKIAFVVSYLGGNAAKWYINHVAKPELQFKSFQEFADAKTLTQTTSCQAYACDFLRWIAGTQHNDYTKMLMFKQGLKLHVMNYIDGLEPQPTNLSMLMRKAIVFDERVFANNKRSGSSKGNQGSGSSSRSNNPGATSKPSGSADVAAADVKSGKPTHEERQRRKDKGLCAYCGQDGCNGASDTKACPLLVAKNARSAQGRGAQA